jgi:uracil-DNA glycosylase family 4
VGRSGQEYTHQYLPLAGLSRDDVRTTNVTKCSCPGYANPSHELAACCADHWLAKELWASEPEILVPMGAVACSLFPKLDLTLRHGIPFAGAYKAWSGWVFPMYHPAAGLHAPEFMVPLQEDFRRLREFRYGKLVIPADPYPNPTYEHITGTGHLSSLLEANDTGELAMDTESARHGDLTYSPWCVTFSYRPGTGYLVRADNHECLRVLAEWIRRLRWLILLHNAPYDLPVLKAMTVEAPRYIDTMSMAYHRMTLPQGLKALAYRLLGMHMQDFDDLCRPFAEAEALTYYEDAERALSKLAKPKRKRGEPVPPLASLKTKVGRLWGDWNKDPNSVDLLKRYEAWDDEDKALLRELMGRCFPVTSIDKAPFPQALVYACRDADATIRLWPVLRRECAGIMRKT